MSFTKNVCFVAIMLAALLGIHTLAQAQTCSNPTGNPGDMIYNSTSGVFQGCTSSGWAAFHHVPPDPCMVSGTPGTPCSDGQTVYAGSWGGNRYYTTVADQTLGSRYGTHNVTLGANARSNSDGLMNTNTALASIDANPQGGACNTAPYNPPACALNAAVLCRELPQHWAGTGMYRRRTSL